MVQIPIEVPDEFSQRLEPFQGQLSELVTRFLASTLPDESSEPVLSAVGFTLPSGAYQEVIDFLISGPTSQEIVGFKVSEQSQMRLQSLLQKNREAMLSAAEREELDLYEQLDALVGLLKAKAFMMIRSPAGEE